MAKTLKGATKVGKFMSKLGKRVIDNFDKNQNKVRHTCGRLQRSAFAKGVAPRRLCCPICLIESKNVAC